MGKGVVIQQSFYEAAQILAPMERLQLYESVFRYGLEGIEPEGLSPVSNSLFTLIRPNVDASGNRYAARCENAAKGGAPKGNQNARKKPDSTRQNNQTETTKTTRRINQDYDFDSDSDTPSKGVSCNNKSPGGRNDWGL